jgi:hypothetical protein
VRQPTSRYQGIGLDALQGIKHHYGQDQATYVQIRLRLRAVKSGNDMKQLAAVHVLANLLDVSEARLEDAAKKLNPDSSYEWRPGVSRPFQMALELMRCDLGRGADALSSIVGEITREQRKKLFEVFTPKWVDLRAAHPLWQEALGAQARRVFVLNTQWPAAANHYVRRAWSHTFDDVAARPITAVDDGSGEGFRDAILRDFKHQLESADPECGEISLEQALGVLQDRSDSHLPVYVAILDKEGVSEAALCNAQRNLPVGILYLREDDKASQCGPEVLVLEPLLTEDQRKAAKRDYLYVNSVVLGRT